MSDIVPLKRCTKCPQELPATLEFFTAYSKGKYGLNSACKDCSNRKQRERTAQKRQGPPLRKIPEKREGLRFCSTCEDWKPATQEYFHAASRGLYGLEQRCKECSSKEHHSRYE